MTTSQVCVACEVEDETQSTYGREHTCREPRISFATCENDCGRDAEHVIGNDGFCAECVNLFSVCQACGSSVLIASAACDETGDYHEACYGPDENYSEDCYR